MWEGRGEEADVGTSREASRFTQQIQSPTVDSGVTLHGGARRGTTPSARCSDSSRTRSPCLGILSMTPSHCRGELDLSLSVHRKHSGVQLAVTSRLLNQTSGPGPRFAAYGFTERDVTSASTTSKVGADLTRTRYDSIVWRAKFVTMEYGRSTTRGRDRVGRVPYRASRPTLDLSWSMLGEDLRGALARESSVQKAVRYLHSALASTVSFSSSHMTRQCLAQKCSFRWTLSFSELDTWCFSLSVWEMQSLPSHLLGRDARTWTGHREDGRSPKR